MTREIKFRAYDHFNDCFYYSEKLGLEIFWRYVSELNDAGNNVVVDQFTGFKDMDGVDIYDSDIVSVFGLIRRVDFMQFIRNVTNSELRIMCVIGNIHKNN